MKVIVIDAIGLHVGFLGCYGNEWIATPTLDSLACEGVVFDNHLADQPVLNNGQVSSARTGRYGFAAESGPDALSLFQERGWQVACVAPALEDLGSALGDAIGEWTTDGNALLWVDGPSLAPPWKLRRRVLEAYFDDDDAVKPWADPPQGRHKDLVLEDWDRLRDTYAAAVTYFDTQIEELIKRLVEGEWAEETLLCLTARSGLPLGEHCQVGDGVGPLHSELVHVPLILSLPGEEHAGTRVRGLTQTVDLLPSLMELLFDDRTKYGGVSFLPLLRKEAEEVRPHAVARDGKKSYLREGEWSLSMSLTEDGTVSRLYLKPEDRWEVNDLRLKDLERAEAMEAQLRGLVFPVDS